MIGNNMFIALICESNYSWREKLNISFSSDGIESFIGAFSVLKAARLCLEEKYKHYTVYAYNDLHVYTPFESLPYLEFLESGIYLCRLSSIIPYLKAISTSENRI